MKSRLSIIILSVFFSVGCLAQEGGLQQTVDEGVKKVESYYKGGMYHEAFEKLHTIEGQIASSGQSQAAKSAGYYKTARARFDMYMRMRRSASAQEHLNNMAIHASKSGDEALKNDYLYNKTIFHYTFGQNEKGNATFKEMATKLTAQKEYDKVDEVYKTLIANGRNSGSANLVAQSYSNYMAWKDSVTVIKHADEIKALKKQIADNEAIIADKDSSITARTVTIIGLGILAGALAIALVLGAIALLRYILLTRNQKKIITTQQDNIALKAKFINNISAQLDPTLKKLDATKPEVKALKDFSEHIQTLSKLECEAGKTLELEDTDVTVFCEALMSDMRGKTASGVELKVNAPKMYAKIHKPYVAQIVNHLLVNATEYTPANGHITLEYIRRGAHKSQFIVSNTGSTIAEEDRDNIFKPFSTIHDLTAGDGLGLPICKQMAMNMGGDLYIDPAFTKGTRFVLDIIV